MGLFYFIKTLDSGYQAFFAHRDEFYMEFVKHWPLGEMDDG